MKRFVIMKGEHNFGTDYDEYTAEELRDRDWKNEEMYPCTLLETFDEDEARSAFAKLKNTAYFASGYASKYTVYATYYCLVVEEEELDENGEYDCDDTIEYTAAEFDSESYKAR